MASLLSSPLDVLRTGGDLAMPTGALAAAAAAHPPLTALLLAAGHRPDLSNVATDTVTLPPGLALPAAHHLLLHVSQLLFSSSTLIDA